MEMLEQQVGVKLQGLLVVCEKDDMDTDYHTKVNGEVFSAGGRPLPHQIRIQFIAYNDKNQVLTVDDLYVDGEPFSGYGAFSFHLYTHVIPSKIKILFHKV